jgi:hypothetical protein
VPEPDKSRSLEEIEDDYWGRPGDRRDPVDQHRVLAAHTSGRCARYGGSAPDHLAADRAGHANPKDHQNCGPETERGGLATDEAHADHADRRVRVALVAR